LYNAFLCHSLWSTDKTYTLWSTDKNQILYLLGPIIIPIISLNILKLTFRNQKNWHWFFLSVRKHKNRMSFNSHEKFRTISADFLTRYFQLKKILALSIDIFYFLIFKFISCWLWRYFCSMQIPYPEMWQSIITNLSGC